MDSDAERPFLRGTAASRSATPWQDTTPAYGAAAKPRLRPPAWLAHSLGSLAYLTRDCRKRPAAFCVGLTTVVLTVFFVSLLQNVVENSPAVFMRLAETQATVLLVDSARELELGLGRAWSHRRLGEGEIHVRDALLRAIGVEANTGTRVNMQFDFEALLGTADGAPLGEDRTAQAERVLGRFVRLDEPFDLGPLLRQQLETSGTVPDVVEVPLADIAESITLPALNTVGGNGSAGNGTLPPGAQLGLPGNATLADLLRVLLGTPALGGPAQVDTRTLLDALLAGPVEVTPRELLGQRLPSGLTLAEVFVDRLLHLSLECVVVDGVPSNEAKFPSAVGNLVVMDAGWFVRTTLQSLCAEAYVDMLELAGAGRLVSRENITRLEATDVAQFAMTAVVMYADRREVYTAGDAERTRRFIEFTNSVFEQIGLDRPVTPQSPVMDGLRGFSFFRLFLDQIFTAVVVVTTVLAALVIYALLMANVDDKAYEYGMLRALGLPTSGLWNLVVLHAQLFGLPGIAVALLLSYGANVPITYALDLFVRYGPTFALPASAVGLPAALGLALPLVASVLPVRRALGRALRESLSHTQQVGQTSVLALRLESLGLGRTQLALAVLMIVTGFTVYYLIPLAFIFSNYAMFFAILNVILMGMLGGLCMVSQSLQATAEHLVLYLLLWGKDRKLRSIITKNMHAHRPRTSLTFLTFTLSIAAIVFGGVVFSLQAESIVQNVRVFTGADVYVTTFKFDAPIEPELLQGFLERHRARGEVLAWSYVSFPLHRYPHVDRTDLSTLVEFPSFKLNLQAVQENFLDCTYAEFVAPDELPQGAVFPLTHKGTPDVVRGLYQRARTASREDPYIPPNFFHTWQALPYDDPTNFTYTHMLPVLLSTAAGDPLSASTTSKLTARIATARGAVLKYMAQPAALVHKAPGFPLFSSYQVTLALAPTLTTVDFFETLLQQTAAAEGLAENVTTRYQTAFIRLADGLGQQAREDFVNQLRGVLAARATYIVADAVAVADSTREATAVIIGFFLFVSVLVLVLEFFMLWLSCTANVQNNSWELGILRAVGLSAAALIRVYVYEALCLVLGGFALGAGIGLLVATTLTLQFNSFFEMPLAFTFPWPLFLWALALSVTAAILGSYIPASRIRDSGISATLKGI